MKKPKIILKTLFAIMLLTLTFAGKTQTTTCENFNDQAIGSWRGSNASVGIGLAFSVDGTYFLYSYDDQFTSWLYNTSYNSANVSCGTICFDYKIFDDMISNDSPNIFNTIQIFSGTVESQATYATFVLNTPITENSPWLRICAPLNTIANGAQLPGNAQGKWVMPNGNSTTWNNLVTSFKGVAINTDVAGSSNQNEQIAIDNFCVTPSAGNCCLAPVNIFNFEDANGIIKTEFCYGENVYMDATASQYETSYYIDIWRRPIGSTENFSWYNGLGWFVGEAGIKNLSDAFAKLTFPSYLTPGYEYSLKLALSNSCVGWESREQTFKIDCCDNYFNGDFLLDVSASQGSYAMTAKNFQTYTNVNLTHEWYVLSSPNPSGGPYTPVALTTTTNQTQVTVLNNAQYGLFYSVFHKIKNSCGDICTRRVQYQTSLGRINTSPDISAAPIDCSILETLWPNCPTPVWAAGDCWSLYWTDVPGATGYVIEFNYNDPLCCYTPYAQFTTTVETSESYYNTNYPLPPQYSCFSWRVAAKCGAVRGPWTSKICYNCSDSYLFRKGQGNTKTDQEKTALNPVVSPNPSNGTMTLSLKAPGDLTLTVEVYSTYGKLVQTLKQKTIPGGQFASTLTLPATEKGLYTVVFKTNYGVFSKKVVVQ
jgi:Secretion system C-terminal sorting domain